MTMTAVRTVNSEPIPGYRLLEPLGKGGYGEVWKCEAPGGLVKAIKIVAGTGNNVAADSNGAEQELRALHNTSNRSATPSSSPWSASKSWTATSSS